MLESLTLLPNKKQQHDTVNTEAIILTFFYLFSTNKADRFEISLFSASYAHSANTDSANFSNTTVCKIKINPQALFAGYLKQEKYPELLFN